jgi:hypothetical protein
VAETAPEEVDSAVIVAYPPEQLAKISPKVTLPQRMGPCERAGVSVVTLHRDREIGDPIADTRGKRLRVESGH